MGRGALERGHDAVVVVLGVRVGLGEPDHFLVIHALPVDDGADLTIAAAGVEADPAALQMSADGLGGVLFRRQFVRVDHFKGALIDVGHEVEVKVPAALVRVGGFKMFEHGPVPGHVDPEPPLHPQQGLHQPVEIIPVRGGVFRRAVDAGVHPGDLPVGPLQGDAHGLRRRLEKGPIEQPHGDEPGIEFGMVGHGDGDAVQIHMLSLLIFSHHTEKPLF